MHTDHGQKIADLVMHQDEANQVLWKENNQLKNIILRYKALYGDSIAPNHADYKANPLIEFGCNNENLCLYNSIDLGIISHRVMALQNVGLIPKTPTQ